MYDEYTSSFCSILSALGLRLARSRFMSTFSFVDEAMNEVNEVSANWEALFRGIGEDGLWCVVDLSDSEADLFDLSNELRMRPLRERLLEALQNWADPGNDYGVNFGNKFFATMGAQQQRSFFCAICDLPISTLSVGDVTNNGAEKPAITIHTSALLDALANLNSSVKELHVSNFALSNQSDVEALSNIILAKRETLEVIYLEGIECPVTYKKRDRDGPIGFLDPLLYASSHLEQPEALVLSARTPPFHSSLVSPEAIRALFGKGRRTDWYFLYLNGLGLNDSHCHVIAEALQAGHTSVDELSFESNPAISAQGYGALLGLNVIDTFVLDDKTWEAELNLVSKMNRYYGRLEYMTDGAFSSEEHRWQWLQKLATMELMGGMDEENLAARHVNYIWYTLRENPAVMQT